MQTLEGRSLEYEIIVIDDGSTDSTHAYASEVAHTNGGTIRVLQHSARLGKGAALVAAARDARGKVVVVLDADLEYAPEEIVRLVEPILQGRSEIVFGSRFAGQLDGMSFAHFLGNRILTKATNPLYSARLTDVMTGYKAFQRTSFDRLKINRSAFTFEVEIAAKALKLGLRVNEVPITYRRRLAGQSKLRWTDGIRCLVHLLELKRVDESS